MKNIVKFAIIATLTATPAMAETKSLKELLEADAARDPYAESASKGITFTDKTVETKTHEIPAAMKIDLDKVEGHRYQKENAKTKTGIQRMPLSKKNNVQVPAPAYDVR